MNEHDIREIENLKKWKENYLLWKRETANMTYEEKIKKFIKGLRGE